MQNSSLLSSVTPEQSDGPSVASSRPKKAVNDFSAWLTAAEAAQYLRIRTRTLLLWARQGKVKGFVLSGIQRHVWRFRRVDLDAALLQPADECVLHSASSSVRSAEKEAAR